MGKAAVSSSKPNRTEPPCCACNLNKETLWNCFLIVSGNSLSVSPNRGTRIAHQDALRQCSACRAAYRAARDGKFSFLQTAALLPCSSTPLISSTAVVSCCCCCWLKEESKPAAVLCSAFGSRMLLTFATTEEAKSAIRSWKLRLHDLFCHLQLY